MEDVDALINNPPVNQEIAKDVVIYYSDSAQVRVRITAPTLIRNLDRGKPNEEFPDGIFVEFLNNRQRVYSRLKADYGIRETLKKQIITRRNVEMYNAKGETIKSSELIWDENDEILFTEKYVMIIQPEKQDTQQGFGFVTNQDFTRFEIKSRGSASINVDKMKAEFKKE